MLGLHPQRFVGRHLTNLKQNKGWRDVETVARAIWSADPAQARGDNHDNGGGCGSGSGDSNLPSESPKGFSFLSPLNFARFSNTPMAYGRRISWQRQNKMLFLVCARTLASPSVATISASRHKAGADSSESPAVIDTKPCPAPTSSTLIRPPPHMPNASSLPAPARKCDRTDAPSHTAEPTPAPFLR